MRWRGRRESTNVSDQRGRGGGFPGRRAGIPIRLPMGRGGGGSISGIIILAVIFHGLRAIGIEPLALLHGGSTGSEGERTAEDEGPRQVACVRLAVPEGVGNSLYRASGGRYCGAT